MSSTYGKVCSGILEDSFGQGVRQVGAVMMRLGPVTLPKIIHGMSPLKMPPNKVKECIKVLIQHNIVTFRPRQGFNDPNYIFDTEAVFNIPRFAEYFTIVESQYGADAMTLVIELVRVGQTSATRLLFNLGSKYRMEANPKEINDKLVLDKLIVYRNALIEIVKNKFLIRCEFITSDAEVQVPLFKEYPYDTEFVVPKIDLPFICTNVMKDDAAANTFIDSDSIIWKIRSETFHLEMRNQVLVDAMRRRLLTLGDERVFKVILNIGLERDPYATTTPAVSVNEIKAALKKMPDGEGILRYLDQHLEMMEDDPLRLVVKTSQANSGLYIVNVKTAFIEVMWTTIEEIIIERHGFHAARIFRLIKKHKYVEQDRLIEMGMIPGKDAKCLTYKLLEDNFILLKEIRKSYTTSNAPSNKIAYVFELNVIQIVNSLLESCYKSMQNARIRLSVEKERQKRLLVKEERIGRILANMKKTNCTEEQFAEVRDMITPPERAVLKRVHGHMTRLTASMIRSDHTVFVLRTFLLFYNTK